MRLQLLMIIVSLQAVALTDKWKDNCKDIVKKQPDYYVCDPVVGFLHKPFSTRKAIWPEHPKKDISFNTNSLGFRENREINPVKQEGVLRILVTGDSHTDGVVNNVESFPHLLEDQINRENGKVEIINGAVGGFSPLNYEKFLEKFSYLNPDVFLVGFYEGNDFVESAAIYEMEHPNPRYDGYWGPLRTASGISGPACFQAYNQIYYFKNFPLMKNPILSFVQNRFLEMKKICEEKNIKFGVVMIPTKLDAGLRDQKKIYKKIEETLNLDPEDYKISQRLSREMIKWFKKNKIAVWDTQSYMSDKNKNYYWDLDYHLGLEGHKAIADGMKASLVTFTKNLPH